MSQRCQVRKGWTLHNKLQINRIILRSCCTFVSKKEFRNKIATNQNCGDSNISKFLLNTERENMVKTWKWRDFSNFLLTPKGCNSSSWTEPLSVWNSVLLAQSECCEKSGNSLKQFTQAVKSNIKWYSTIYF